MFDLKIEGEQKEIREIQERLNHYPDTSRYWESRSGQDDLKVIQELMLEPKTTAQFRREWYHEQMRKSSEDWP